MKRHDNDVPEIMTLTAELNDESVQHAEPKAGMFLLFLISGLTMLGTLGGMILAASFIDRNTGSRWLSGVLLSSALGGVIGCGAGMLVLGFMGLVRWERRDHNAESQHRNRA